jgi:hypothetical protein
MLNPFKDVDWKPNRAKRREFARSLIIGFPCVAVVLLVLGWVRTGAWNFHGPLVVGGVGVGLGLIFWAMPGIARPFYCVWYAVACAIGLVMGNVLLGLVFFLFFTAIGWAKRTMGKQALQRTPDKQAASYWVDVKGAEDPRSYYRQF